MSSLSHVFVQGGTIKESDILMVFIALSQRSGIARDKAETSHKYELSHS